MKLVGVQMVLEGMFVQEFYFTRMNIAEELGDG